MKTKAAALAFTLTLFLTSLLGVSQINSAKNKAPSMEQQAMKKTNNLAPKTDPNLKTLP